MELTELLNSCTLCPRGCKVNRAGGERGYCGAGKDIVIARVSLHQWEEPCISFKNGSGTVFFSNCCLKCCFCQNYEISARGKGFTVTVSELADIFLKLQSRGADNINLVTPTPYTLHIIKALDKVRGELKIPVVYNCGGYESTETLEMLRSYVDIFLPDLKYYSSDMSCVYSRAENYFEKASAAIKKMAELTGKPLFDENGKMLKGVIVRHLVLPNGRHDTARLIEWLSQNFEKDEILVSLMSQFVPVYKAFEHKALSRRTSTFEYNYAADLLEKSGFDGYMQKRSSADTDFIPQFHSEKHFDFNVKNN